MATVVCQGLQSCVESQIVEPRTTLRLKLTSPMTHYSQPLDILALKSCFSDIINSERSNFEEDCLINKKPNNLNNWSFLQALSNISQSPKVEKESTYVHPLDKCSKCCLSEKSLKLCTENLGNETGTDIIETTIFSMSSCSSMESISKEVNDKQKQRKVLLGARKAKPMKNFPPPLTTIRGMDCLQVKSHRENGRLVMKAIKNPSKPSAFHVERSHGRLRLTLLEKSTSGFDSENGGDKADNNESKEFEVDPIGIEEDQKEEEEEGDDNDKNDLEEQESKEGKRDECLDEDVDENSEFVGGKMGMKIFEMSRRCKEGGENESKTMLNWEPFWVGST